MTIVTHAHIAADPRPAPPVRTTVDVLAGIAEELAATGCEIDVTQLAWAINEYPKRMHKALGLVRS